MTEDLKVRENRLRRMASRQALFLSKTRRIDKRAIDWRTYSLLDERDRIIKGCDQVSLDAIEAYLTDDRRIRKQRKE